MHPARRVVKTQVRALAWLLGVGKEPGPWEGHRRLPVPTGPQDAEQDSNYQPGSLCSYCTFCDVCAQPCRGALAQQGQG